MKLGVIFLPYWEPERLPAFARAADEAGIDELWLWEDCFVSGGISSASVALAQTSRFHVGVGHGVLDWMGQVGVRASSPMTLLREYVTALQGLLGGSTVEVAGEYVRLRDVSLGWPADPRPPLYVGAKGPKTLALAAELGDGTILTNSAPVADVANARRVLDASGPARRLTTFLDVAPSVDGTLARIREWADAGADAVILQPPEGSDPDDFGRFALDDVLPRI